MCAKQDLKLEVPKTSPRLCRNPLSLSLHPIQRLRPLLPNFISKIDPQKLTVIPLGGCGEFGMNMTAYIFAGRLYIVDCGLMFPDATKLGVDAIIPDPAALIEHFGGVGAYVLTHGHEDHIGATPHIVPRWPAPVYGTAWTLELVKEKFQRNNHGSMLPLLHKVSAGEITAIGPGLSCRWVHVNHSIPNTTAVLLRCASGSVFHTGDFKIDDVCNYEPLTDLPAFTEIGNQGVDVVVCDSTNATQVESGPTERDAAENLEAEIAGATGAVFITTFSSNFWRMRTVIEICTKLGKGLRLLGAGMQKNFRIAGELGLLPKDINCILDEHRPSTLPRDKLVVLASGCQGEPNSAISRLIQGEFRHLRFHPGDKVVFSSRVIPGNEYSYLAIINACAAAGLTIVTSRDKPLIHASGHACQPDIKEILSRLRPKYFLPVHGTYVHMAASRAFAAATFPKIEGMEVEDGDAFEISSAGLKRLGNFEPNTLYIDSMSGQTMPIEMLRDRLRIGSSGLVMLSGVVEPGGLWPEPLTADFVGVPTASSFNVEGWLESVAQRLSRMLADEDGWLAPAERTNLVRQEAERIARRELSQRLGKKPSVFAKIFVTKTP